MSQYTLPPVNTGGDEADDTGLAEAMVDGYDVDVDYEDLSPEAKAYVDALFAKAIEKREGFGKYAPGQARDDHGRFASGGTMAGSVGHEVARRTLSEGGSSVHLKTKWTPSTGFMVSTVGHEEVFDKARISGRTIKDYIHRHRDVLAREDAFLGAWHDTSSGKVYLDVSIRVPDRESAMALGRENKQLAIYDAGKDEVIDIEKTMQHMVLSKDPEDADEVAEFLRSL